MHLYLPSVGRSVVIESMKAEEVVEVGKITSNKKDNTKKDDCYEGGIGVKARVRAMRVYH